MTRASKASFQLRHSSGRVETFEDSAAFVAAATQAMATLASVEAVVAFWEANLDSFVLLPRATNGEDPVHAIGSALKNRVRALARSPKQPAATVESEAESEAAPGPLLIPKEKRIRDKAHLAFVANEPCLVCGRKPAHAHHLRFAQPSALGLKVSDEYTVPLCNIHHDSLHQTGDERAWWARHGILEPLKFAARLWAASRGRSEVKRKTQGRFLRHRLARDHKRQSLMSCCTEPSQLHRYLPPSGPLAQAHGSRPTQG